MKVNLARPDITQAEIDAVLDVLNSYTLALWPKNDSLREGYGRILRTEARDWP